MSEIATYTLEPLYLSNQRLLSTESQLMLNESMKEMLTDATQFIVGAAVEYGLVATVAGAPAGPVIETISDSMFAAESVASTLAAVDDVIATFGELSGVIQQIMSLSLQQGFNAFYEQVLNIWTSVEKLLPGTSIEKLEELIDGAKETLHGIITKFSDFVSDAVKLVIPEATIGTIVGEGLQKLLTSIAENAYSMLTSLIEQLGQYQQVVTDPSYAANLFNTIFSEINVLLDKLQQQLEVKPEGIGDVLSSIGAAVADPTGEMQNFVAAKSIDLFRDVIVEKQPLVMTLIDKITSIMFPALFALLASYQILMKDEWKTKKEIGVDDAKTGLTPGRGGPGENALDVLLAAGRSRSFRVLAEVTGGGIGVPQPTGYGPNYHTVNADPITWENLEGPEYFVTSQPDGSVLAGVSLPGTNLATPTYEFADEASAMSWVRNTFEKYRREFMAQESPPR